MSDTDISTACSYLSDNDSELDNLQTAVPFELSDPVLLELVVMGKRAAKARRRAARILAEAENEGKKPMEAVKSTESDMTSSSLETSGNSENSQIQNSKIPVLLKGYKFDVNCNLVRNNDDSNSKIPRPVDKLVYLYRNTHSGSDDSSVEESATDSEPVTTDESESFTGQEASFDTSQMITGVEDGKTCKDWVSPIQHCDLSTETGSSGVNDSVGNDENEHFKIVAGANGVEVELDMTAFVNGMNLDINGIKIV